MNIGIVKARYLNISGYWVSDISMLVVVIITNKGGGGDAHCGLFRANLCTFKSSNVSNEIRW